MDFINEVDTEANGPGYYYYKVINKLGSCKYVCYIPTRSHEFMKKLLSLISILMAAN